METYGWFKEEYNKVEDTPEFKQESFECRIVPEYQKYYSYAKKTVGCDVELICCSVYDQCKIPKCMIENHILPCKNCLFWLGYETTQEEIKQYSKLMKYCIL